MIELLGILALGAVLFLLLEWADPKRTIEKDQKRRQKNGQR
jgi:hypothetical protein